jgi:hypothetical protein
MLRQWLAQGKGGGHNKFFTWIENLTMRSVERLLSLLSLLSLLRLTQLST